MPSRTSIALCVPVLVAVFTLHGCGDAGKGGTCKSMENKGSGSLASAASGDSGAVTCPSDEVYDGPALECGWVTKTCCAASQGDIDDKTHCFNSYDWVEKGDGLKKWPGHQKPTLLDPDDKRCPPKEKKVSKPDKAGSEKDDSQKHDATEGGVKDDSENAAAEEQSEDGTRRRLASLPSVIEEESLTCKKKPKPAKEEKKAKGGDKDETDSEELGDDDPIEESAGDKDETGSHELADDEPADDDDELADDELADDELADDDPNEQPTDNMEETSQMSSDIENKFSMTGDQIASGRRTTTGLSILAVAAVTLGVMSVVVMRRYRTALHVPLAAEPLAQDDPRTLAIDAEQGNLVE